MTGLRCPKCGAMMEEHGTAPGDAHWYLCRNCGAVLDDPDRPMDGQMDWFDMEILDE